MSFSLWKHMSCETNLPPHDIDWTRRQGVHGPKDVVHDIDRTRRQQSATSQIGYGMIYLSSNLTFWDLRGKNDYKK